jgi:hypothetical protein
MMIIHVRKYINPSEPIPPILELVLISMFKSSLLTTTSRSLLRTTKPTVISLTRPFTSSTSQLAKMDAYKKIGNRKDAPPAHKMVHFQGLLSEKRSFGDFRTVLHTGLFSQLVAMEVPVGGEIGDEVCSFPH